MVKNNKDFTIHNRSVLLYSTLIFCIVKKTGLILLLLVVLWWVGRSADEIRVDFEIFKIVYRLNYSDFYFV